ncbi:hypothetical protein [Embleya sp. NBC_00896]|uniref:hypothetical protein n=1 Tax=Embleya sp. NBC_00896 TaxID=2975961 RepID=UPI00386B4EE5|nr:hypothetical protein OG928_03090 [Embleya sp. NBC_00896]
MALGRPRDRARRRTRRGPGGRAGRTRRELGAGAAAATWEQAARLTADHPVARRRYVAAAYAAWEAGFPVRARTLLDTADATDVDGAADDGSSAGSSGTAIRLRAALRHAEGHRSEAGALLLDAAHGRAALLLAATGAAWEAGDRARTSQARTALSALPLADDDPLRTVVAALGADGVSPRWWRRPPGPGCTAWASRCGRSPRSRCTRRRPTRPPTTSCSTRPRCCVRTGPAVRWPRR